MSIEAMNQAFEVPLVEQLESVPTNARLVIDDADGMGTRYIAVGRMCHDASKALRQGIAEAEKQEPMAWRNAAIRIGEELSSVGPDGYYDMTAEQWLNWAMEQQPHGKNSLSQQTQEQKTVTCSMCNEWEKVCDQHLRYISKLKKKLEKNT